MAGRRKGNPNRGISWGCTLQSCDLGTVVVQLLSCVPLLGTPWTAVCQGPLFLTVSWSLLKLVLIESVMPSNPLTLCHSLLLPSIFPSIRVILTVPASESWPGEGCSSHWLQFLQLYPFVSGIPFHPHSNPRLSAGLSVS